MTRPNLRWPNPTGLATSSVKRIRGCNTQAWLKEIHAPILIIHCSQDPVIPFQFGQEVFAAALPPKSFLQINGSCHEESSLIAPTQYQTALQEFLSSL